MYYRVFYEVMALQRFLIIEASDHCRSS